MYSIRTLKHYNHTTSETVYHINLRTIQFPTALEKLVSLLFQLPNVGAKITFKIAFRHFLCILIPKMGSLYAFFYHRDISYRKFYEPHSIAFIWAA